MCLHARGLGGMPLSCVCLPCVCLPCATLSTCAAGKEGDDDAGPSVEGGGGGEGSYEALLTMQAAMMEGVEVLEQVCMAAMMEGVIWSRPVGDTRLCIQTFNRSTMVVKVL